ncbi:MAG: adenylate kinase [Oscillospiraceae bacterium]|jgi:adenylate kinase|nr:adenylate kinase [Oscillospiraceae bacterium]
MKLVLLGAPGAGKGTQAQILSDVLGVPMISTGNILRAAVKNGTPVGLRAKAFMDAGELVPDEVIIGVIRERMAEPDCANGYILDAMPRTIAQAEALEDDGIEVETALSIEISDEEIVGRMSGRRVCPDCGATYHILSAPPKTDGKCDKCGAELIIRKDDEAETVRNRLRVYHAETEPLISFYGNRSKLKTVQNQPSIAATTKVVFAALGIAE